MNIGNQHGMSEETWAFILDHQKIIHSECSFILGRTDTTDDIISDIKIKIYLYFINHNIHTSSIENPKSWIRKTSRNQCLDYLRKCTRYKKIFPATDDVYDIDKSQNTEKIVFYCQVLLLVEENLKDLPEALKDSLIARCINEESYSVIAQNMEITEQNARKRVEQARKHLKAVLPLQITAPW